MTTLPEEAVKAAMDAFHEAWNNNQGLDNELPAYAHRAALTAALPFLSALEPSACGYPQWANLADQSKNEDGSYKEPSAGRAAALEEAAKIAEDYVQYDVADAIRLLALHPVADKPDEAGEQWEGWKPIESAPKDGTSILAVCAGVHERTGIPFIPEVVEWTQYGWSNEMWGEQPNHGIYSPTHWRPLPTPPSGEVA